MNKTELKKQLLYTNAKINIFLKDEEYLPENIKIIENEIIEYEKKIGNRYYTDEDRKKLKEYKDIILAMKNRLKDVKETILNLIALKINTKLDLSNMEENNGH